MPDPFPSETLREIADRARVALGADQALVLPLAGGEPLPPGPEGGPSLSAPIRIDGDPVATLIVSRDPGGSGSPPASGSTRAWSAPSATRARSAISRRVSEGNRSGMVRLCSRCLGGAYAESGRRIPEIG